ncbi:Mur ligase family protein [Deinococcus hopiensis]|nr:Mur ligase family protein [Deinococcus hopiensis]
MDLYAPFDFTSELHALHQLACQSNPQPATPLHTSASQQDGPCISAASRPLPIISITGTNGKSTTSRMVAHIFRHAGKRVGLTTSNGIYINGEQIVSGDTTGPKSAKVVLNDPNVEVAVLETARGGILREGLGFDRCDVGAVLNIQPDHLGLKGIETVEDLAWVKSLVVEVVADTGTSVLNADDELTLGMRRKAGGHLTLFSMHGGNAASKDLQEHIAGGGTALVREPTVLGDELVLYEGGQRHPIMRARDIPATLGGFAQVNVQNALAAAAIAVAQNIELPVIRAALGSFSTSFEQSPGRLNLYDGHPFRVLLDYAHNPSGMEYLRDLVAHLRPPQGRVIGVMGVAGDRRDEDIRRMGELAAVTFDELVVREDQDRRGRPPLEAAHWVEVGARSAGLPPQNLTTIIDEPQAVHHALCTAYPGDLVILLATDVEGTWQQLLNFQGHRTPLERSEGDGYHATSHD